MRPSLVRSIRSPDRRHDRLLRRIVATSSAMELLAVFLTLAVTACNPFAPALEEGDPFVHLLGDPATIDGFFTNFRNAYELRDIALYEPLLDSAFIFLYYDFDARVERQWGFPQELESTRRLFQRTNMVQLRWNQIISQFIEPSNREAFVVRSFNLTITLENNDVFRGDGNVNFLLIRPDSTAAWQLRRWRDESAF
jgi:hypothetical protein